MICGSIRDCGGQSWHCFFTLDIPNSCDYNRDHSGVSALLDTHKIISIYEKKKSDKSSQVNRNIKQKKLFQNTANQALSTNKAGCARLVPTLKKLLLQKIYVSLERFIWFFWLHTRKIEMALGAHSVMETKIEK